jgi:hypothetical protein
MDRNRTNVFKKIIQMNKTEELEKRIKELEMKADGKCPECGRVIKGWKPVFGFFAPEWWGSMREQGIDPATGHSASCNNKDLKI